MSSVYNKKRFDRGIPYITNVANLPEQGKVTKQICLVFLNFVNIVCILDVTFIIENVTA